VKNNLDVIKRERGKKLVVWNEVTYVKEFIELIIFKKKGGGGEGLQKLRKNPQQKRNN